MERILAEKERESGGFNPTATGSCAGLPTITPANTMNRSLIVLAAAMLPAVSGLAQDWAKNRLEKSPRHLESVKVKHDSREVNCSWPIRK